MATADELMALLNKQEELHPVLKMYLEDDGPFGQCIRHPLVYSMIHTPQHNAYANEQLRYKLDALKEAREKGAWHSYVYLHERPYRLDAFTDIREELGNEEYWGLLSSIWTDSENHWQNRDLWEECLQDRPDRHLFMEDEDRVEFAMMGPEFEVHRGFHHDDALHGFSWTTNPYIAKWFARRLARPDDVPRVATGTVKKELVIGLLNGRGENEIVALPEDIIDISIREVGLAEHAENSDT